MSINLDISVVDLHSHVLPNLDDGARNDDEALEMLRVAAADGIDVITATPHLDQVRHVEQIIDDVARLNDLAAEYGIQITVVPGCEALIAVDLIDRYQSGQLITLNGTSYILLELPLIGEWPAYLQGVIYDLQLAGLTPILAHAERYPAVRRNPSILHELIATGVIIQINASSLRGSTGGESRQTAEVLVRQHMAHIVASDAHRPHGRSPKLQEALRRVAALAGSGYAEGMIERADSILHGGLVGLPTPREPQDDSWLAKLRGRFLKH